MSNAEIEPPVADIYQLEAYRSPEEVYAAFYRDFDSKGLTEQGYPVARTLLNGRVLHVDETNDRSTHILLHVLKGARTLPVIRQFAGEIPRHILPYSPEDFAAITTDGASITKWQATYAQGTYNYWLDTIHNPYNADRETLEIDFTGSNGKRARLQCNIGKGNGIFMIEDGPTAWILAEDESELERTKLFSLRDRMVQPLAKIVVNR